MKLLFTKKLLTITGITAAMLLGGQNALAAPHHQQQQKYGKHKHGLSINARQQKQAQRIRAGKRDGSLTRVEVKTLKKQQRRIKQLERHFRSDGKLTRVEKRQLHSRLDRAARRIARERHDNEYRPVRHTRNNWQRW